LDRYLKSWSADHKGVRELEDEGHEPEMGNAPWKKVLAFLFLTALLSSPFYYLIISSGSWAGGGLTYVLGLMWAPGISGLLTRFLFQRNLREVGWGWGKTRYQVSSYLIPIGAGVVVYGLAWAVGVGGFSSQDLSPRVFASSAANIVHASHNQVLQRIFDPLTVDLGSTHYLTTEFGLGLAVLYLVGGFWCWTHRKDLPRS
jgi:hypothetical protein